MLLVDEGQALPRGAPGATLPVRVGGKPQNLALLVASLDLVPSVLPGLISLGIGSGLTTLTSLGAKAIEPKGWVEFPVPVPLLPLGALVYLQGAELDPVGPTLPLLTTGVGSFVVQ